MLSTDNNYWQYSYFDCWCVGVGLVTLFGSCGLTKVCMVR